MSGGNHSSESEKVMCLGVASERKKEEQGENKGKCLPEGGAGWAHFREGGMTSDARRVERGTRCVLSERGECMGDAMSARFRL